MKHKTLFMLLVGIGVLAVMMLLIRPAKIEEALKLANPGYLALAFILQFIIYGLLTERWFINIKPLGISVKKLHLLPMLWVGLAVNNLTPSARGEENHKSLYTKQIL
jgi:glycosyltransferase 2 family protein